MDTGLLCFGRSYAKMAGRGSRSVQNNDLSSDQSRDLEGQVMPTCSLATSGDSRVIYPNEQLQRDIYVVIVPPPLDALDDDPVIVIGIFEYAALKLAADVWAEAYT